MSIAGAIIKRLLTPAPTTAARCPHCGREFSDSDWTRYSLGAREWICRECKCVSRWCVARTEPYLLGYTGSSNPLEQLFDIGGEQ